MTIPETWAWVPLNKIILDMQPGFAQRPGSGAAIPQIRTHNVSPHGEIVLNGIKSVTPDSAELEKYSLQPGDIVFNNTNSEEWVGKTALFSEKGTYVFSNHMTRIRTINELVEPEYLAKYLHFLWKSGYSRRRAKRWVNQAAVDQAALLNFKIALPVSDEQKRIITILNQMNDLRRLRKATVEQSRGIPIALFIEVFGHPADTSRWKRQKLGEIAEIKYGIAEKLNTTLPADEGYRILTISNVTLEGDLDLSVIRYSPRVGIQVDEAKLDRFDLLFNWRSGSPEHVGKTAIWEESRDEPVLHVSFLLRIRANRQFLEPYYLWVLLNLYRSLGFFSSSGRRQVNTKFNAHELSELRIPVPSLDIQQLFAKKLLEIRTIQSELATSEDAIRDLVSSVMAKAFTGDLTQPWRESHRRELEDAAQVRDKALKIAGARVTIQEYVPEERPWQIQQERTWLKNQLSELQEHVWKAMQEWKGTLIPSEDMADFKEKWPIEHLDNADDQIFRALNQLAGLGLLAKIAVPNTEGEYVTAFRGMREEEFSRNEDIEALSKMRG